MVQLAERCDAFQTVGRLHSVRGLLRTSLNAAVGELCSVEMPGGKTLLAEVVGFDEKETQLMCFEETDGLQAGLRVVSGRTRRSVPVGQGLLGRVVDGLGRPLDNHGLLREVRSRPETTSAPDAMSRNRIEEPLPTGQRVIDMLLTIGRGQRVGLFAGSGVGKSTLLGEIARGTSADINVIALVGERGREVRPFIEDSLGPEGLARSVVVVATSDQTPLMRIKAVLSAITMAEHFRDEGADVLFFLDSLTRLATAQRQLGLLLGEPPGTRGYPPSVQSLMASVLERLGTGPRGSITGLITVLVEGDDMDEPIADAARSILDGHLVLKRSLAAQGHFPAVDVLDSVSRLFRDVTSTEHQASALHVRRLLATYAEMEDLIQIGAYKGGSSPAVDKAIRLMPAVRMFLQQKAGQNAEWKESLSQLTELGKVWAA